MVSRNQKLPQPMLVPGNGEPGGLDSQLPGVYDLLVLERGWPPDRYQDWITAVMRSTLLPD